jgi:hypothetical protein
MPVILPSTQTCCFDLFLHKIEKKTAVVWSTNKFIRALSKKNGRGVQV